MAYVYKAPRSPFFYASWRTAKGILERRSTKLRCPKAAQKIADQLENTERSIRDHNMHESWMRHELNHLSRRLLGEQNAPPTCKEWFEQWMEGKKTGLSASTSERYEFCIKIFKRQLGARVQLPLDCITANDIIHFRDKLLRQGKRAATVNMDLKIIRAILERAKNVGYISRNPAYAIDLIPKHKDAVQRKPFTPEQVKAILYVTADTEWHGVVLMGYYTALRMGDIVNMKWSAIDLQKRIISLTPQKTKRLGKKIQIPIHEQLYEWLKSRPMAINGNLEVFPELAGGKPGGKSGLSEKFAKILAKAGIDRGWIKSGEASRLTSSLSFHSLRHTCASELANHGVAPEVRMLLTGHNDLKTHEGYTHLTVETIRQAVNIIPKVG